MFLGKEGVVQPVRCVGGTELPPVGSVWLCLLLEGSGLAGNVWGIMARVRSLAMQEGRVVSGASAFSEVVF